MRKWLLILAFGIACLSSVPAKADGTLIQSCNQSFSSAFATTSVGCTLPSPIGANHLLIVTGYSCRTTCFAVGTQATHAMSDSLGLTYTNAVNTVFNSPRRGGDITRESIWYVETGATTGSDTVTLTLNVAAGNGIFVSEWSGIATSSPLFNSDVTQGSFAGGGTAPITYTGGTIAVLRTANTATALANINSASDWVIQFLVFTPLTGNYLLYVQADCENCGGLFQHVPATYTKIASSVGANDNIDMNAVSLPGSPLRGGSQVY